MSCQKYQTNFNSFVRCFMLWATLINNVVYLLLLNHLYYCLLLYKHFNENLKVLENFYQYFKIQGTLYHLHFFEVLVIEIPSQTKLAYTASTTSTKLLSTSVLLVLLCRLAQFLGSGLSENVLCFLSYFRIAAPPWVDCVNSAWGVHFPLYFSWPLDVPKLGLSSTYLILCCLMKERNWTY